MKITDYCPRAAPFDTYLKGRDLVGVEVGVDVGAHAEALLTYYPIIMLHLVDPWTNIERRGYCDGRLSRFRGRYDMHRCGSIDGARLFKPLSLDFVYLDQHQEQAIVSADLEAWWPLVKQGGVLGRRGYGGYASVNQAVDEFAAKRGIKVTFEDYLSDAILLKP